MSQLSIYVRINPDRVRQFNSQRDKAVIKAFSIKTDIVNAIDVEGLRIARIDLNYDRSEMINLLEQRGTAMKLENHDAAI